MKRGALVVALFIALNAAPLFAQDNHQKIYPIDSEVYQAIKALYISQGLALPSTTGPWSGDELLRMLDRLDTSALRNGEQAAWDYALSELAPPKKNFTFTGILTAEAYAHTNPDEFTRTDDYIRPMNLTKPFLDMNFEFWLTPYAYGLGAFSLGIEKYNTMVKEDGGAKRSVGSTFFGATPFSTNILMLPPGGLTDLNFNFPSRAFVSVGGQGWNIELGRERLSWGPGESGNFLVGSQVEYHNNFRTAWYNDQFKYTFNVSGFPSPDEYYQPDANGKITWMDDTGWEHEGINLFIAHRLEWRILNKVNMVLSEAIMYQPENQIDLQYFLPTIVLHNLYRAYEANSLISLEADWAVLPILNIYGQIAMDQFHLPGEGAPGVEDDATPDAFAFMVGAKTAFPLWNGMLSGSFEGVYTDPYLYLRAQTLNASSTKRELNYVVANRHTSMSWGSIDPLFVEEFLGYRWGGDAIVLNANAVYREYGKWSAGANLMFMIHGTFDKWTRWTDVDPQDNAGGWGAGENGTSHEYENLPGNQSAPTDSHYQGNYADTNPQSRNAPYYLTALSLFGTWNIFRSLPGVKSLDLYGQIDLALVANKGNIKSDALAADVQFTIGLSYSF
jgi:hypothetical protein